jgi:methenyltetrahydrofolate cyclohydrolase
MFTNKSCNEFAEVLASSSPVPGGGGASAMVGALGVALGSMVGNLTLGKKKYEKYEADIKKLLEKAGELQKELMDLVEKDAEVFKPLSEAYGLPKNTEEEIKHREKVMENALRFACSVPIKIMEKSLEAIALHEEFREKGTTLAVSDVGVGVLFCKSALMGASLNVFINTKLMKDRDYADSTNARVNKLLEEGTKKADEIYEKVELAIR